MNVSIKPGQTWNDTKGERIQAHGACVYCENGVYYWIGENKEFTDGKKKIWTWGIRLYTSTDLYNWEDKGLIIQPEPKNKKSVLHPKRRMDRPHLIYNAKTKKYVLWIKYCDKNHFSIHVADNIQGPYCTVNDCYHAYGKQCGDFDLAVDKKTGQAYLFFESNHTEVLVCKLSDDYLTVKGDYKAIYENMRPPYTPEGITHLERNGKHYVISSGMTGYCPNPSQVAVADDFMGEYKVQGNPHVNDESCASFNSQISSVFRVANTDLYIAVADRWVPQYVMTKERYETFCRVIRGRYDKSVKSSFKDLKELLKSPMMGGKTNTSIAQYVWLPIRFQGENLLIEWHDEWRIEDFI